MDHTSLLREIIIRHTIVGEHPKTFDIAQDAFKLGREKEAENTDSLKNDFLNALELISESALLLRRYEYNHRNKIQPLPPYGEISYDEVKEKNHDAWTKAQINAAMASKLESFLYTSKDVKNNDNVSSI